jgi:DNA-binding transcriptional MerR regulator
VDEHLLTSGAFARRSRLSRKALRLYERIGLLVPAEVDGLNGYRRYRPEQLEAARLIVWLRRLDMPLPLVAEFLAAPDADRAGLLERYWDGVEHRVAYQRDLAARLHDRLTGLEGGQVEGAGAMYEIEEREVGEQRVLTEQAHVLVHDLPAWIGAAMGRLVQAAEEEAAGVTGPAFVIYHGEVNEESDGPVEACLPIAAGAATSAASRVEPAHREVFTRLTKQQVRFPEILGAFDATAQWIEGRGLTASASPREVYFGDWSAAADGDPVCDVAYPVVDPVDEPVG